RPARKSSRRFSVAWCRRLGYPAGLARPLGNSLFGSDAFGLRKKVEFGRERPRFIGQFAFNNYNVVLAAFFFFCIMSGDNLDQLIGYWTRPKPVYEVVIAICAYTGGRLRLFFRPVDNR